SVLTDRWAVFCFLFIRVCTPSCIPLYITTLRESVKGFLLLSQDQRLAHLPGEPEATGRRPYLDDDTALGIHHFCTTIAVESHYADGVLVCGHTVYARTA